MRLPIVLCILSKRPWFSLYSNLLDMLESNFDLTRFVPSFVRAAYEAGCPTSSSLRELFERDDCRQLYFASAGRQTARTPPR